MDCVVLDWKSPRERQKAILKILPKFSIINHAPTKKKIERLMILTVSFWGLLGSPFRNSFEILATFPSSIFSFVRILASLLSWCRITVYIQYLEMKRNKIILFNISLFTMICFGRTNCRTQIWKIYWNDFSWPLIKKI